MNKACKSLEYKKKVALLKAMAHPVRLAILEELYGRAMTACEIAGLFESDRTTVSKHVAVLKSTGLIGCRKQGRNVFYFLNVPCVLEVLPCIERAQAEKEKEDLDRPGCCSGAEEVQKNQQNHSRTTNQGGITS
jgi:ArsR family transcriptional regulator